MQKLKILNRFTLGFMCYVFAQRKLTFNETRCKSSLNTIRPSNSREWKLEIGTGYAQQQNFCVYSNQALQVNQNYVAHSIEME